jgi:hypothetical protein
MRPPVVHSAGIGRTGQKYVDYSVEACVRANDLLFDVFRVCINKPRKDDQVAVDWAQGYKKGVEQLVERLADIRAAHRMMPSAP